MANSTATAPPAGKTQQPVAMAPFRAGTQPTLVSDGYVNSTQLGATAITLPVYTPSPNNQIRGLYLQVVSVSSGNSVATVVMNEGMPLNIFSTVMFSDANNKPIVGPFNSFDLHVACKFGGFQFNGDARASAVYSVTTLTGTNAAAGSFTEILYVPIEVNLRGFGALQNQSSDSTFNLQLTLAQGTGAQSTGAVFSTAPTTLPTVTTTIYPAGWWKGNNSAASATPPAAGSTQYLTLGSYSSLNGSVQQQLSQGLGYPIRNMIFINLDVSNLTRATGDTDFPTTTQLLYKGTSYFNISKTLWKDLMSRAYGFTSTTADSANGLENGVYVLPWFMQDVDLRPGNELALGYLNTNQGDLHQLLGTFNGSSNLYFVCNYVATVGAYASVQGKV
jgi:hypothetical protein